MAKPPRSSPAFRHASPIPVRLAEPAPESDVHDEIVRRDEARYRTLVGALTQIVWTAGATGEFVEDQPSWREFTGQLATEVAGWGWLEAVHEDDRTRIRQTWRRAVGAGAVFHAEFRLRRHDGVHRWVSARGAPVLGAAGEVAEWIGTVTDVDELRRATEERARLLEGERRARSEAVRLSQQLATTLEQVRFLAEASRVLGSSLDFEATLQTVARLAVPVLADYCIVDLIGVDGNVRRLATAHADQRHQQLLDELRQWPPVPGADDTVARVLRTGEPEVVADLEGAGAAAGMPTHPPELAATIRKLAPKSHVCVPLVVGERVIGSLLCVSVRPSRRYGGDDLPLVQELAGRAAVAVLNARLHAGEHAARLAAERATARLRAAQNISDAAAAEEGLDDMLATLADRLRKALQADTATVLLLDETHGELAVRVALGIDDDAAQHARVQLGHGFAGRVAVDRQPRAADTDRPESAEAALHAGLASLVGAPIVASGRLIGVLHVGTRQQRDFGDDDVRLLQLVADRVAHAIERAQLLEAEQAARAEAEKANRAKMDFLAMMSHELRTPLNAIAGYAELLELGLRGPVTEAQLIDLRAIRRNEQHLLTLIEEVLSFAKLDAGRIQLDIGDIKLAAAVESAISIVRSQIERKGLTTSLVTPAPDLVAVGDLEKVQQVLVNLFSNAIKFTPSGGSITLTTAADPARVFVRVRDSGIGIPAEQHERIFEPFVQLDGGLTRKSAGTGLGLAISRELARAMGGDLTVTSVPGAGAEFILALPRKPRG